VRVNEAFVVEYRLSTFEKLEMVECIVGRRQIAVGRAEHEQPLIAAAWTLHLAARASPLVLMGMRTIREHRVAVAKSGVIGPPP
jgi:hypothetical protein